MDEMILEFASAQLVLILALVVTCIQLLALPSSNDLNQLEDTVTILLRKSRKRSRNQSSQLESIYQLRKCQESFLHLHREISCPWYIKPRTKQWYLLYSDFVFRDDPDRFKLFFRISPETFSHICEMVHDLMLTNPPRSLMILPNRKLQVSRQVAIAIRRLSTGDQTLDIAELFGVSSSTVTKVTWKFIQALNIRGCSCIKWPCGSDLERVKAAFALRGFPGCCGVIDGTHFLVELPRGEQSVDYFDYKHNVSVSMQAIVDQDLRFLDVVARWPGSVQDSWLLRNNRFYGDVVFSDSKLNGCMYVCRDGVNLREYVLGDAGYPLYDWLIVPYAKGQGRIYEDWNFVHSSVRMCVERSFGRLKGSWRILSRILGHPRKERIGPMIYACCILHNVMIEKNDVVNPADIDSVTPHPRGYGPISVPTREFFEGGPEAQDALLEEVMGSDNRRVTRRRTQ